MGLHMPSPAQHYVTPTRCETPDEHIRCRPESFQPGEALLSELAQSPPGAVPVAQQYQPQQKENPHVHPHRTQLRAFLSVCREWINADENEILPAGKTKRLERRQQLIGRWIALDIALQRQYEPRRI